MRKLAAMSSNCVVLLRDPCPRFIQGQTVTITADASAIKSVILGSQVEQGLLLSVSICAGQYHVHAETRVGLGSKG